MISPYGAFCTSLPPELELEAEPITNRREEGLIYGAPTGLAVLTYLTSETNGTRLGRVLEAGKPIFSLP